MHSEEGLFRALQRARQYLRPPQTTERTWPVLAAAAAFAASSLIFATAAILSPSARLTHLPPPQTDPAFGPPLAGTVN